MSVSQISPTLGRKHLFKMGITKGQIEYLHTKFPDKFGKALYPGGVKFYSVEDAVAIGELLKINITNEIINNVYGIKV